MQTKATSVSGCLRLCRPAITLGAKVSVCCLETKKSEFLLLDKVGPVNGGIVSSIVISIHIQFPE